jgi:hypothetical protein
MSTKKKGILVPAPQWAKHLRHGWDRIFWKKHRKAEKRLAAKELKEALRRD